MDVEPIIIDFASMVITSEVRTLRVRGVIRRSEEEDISGTLMLELLDAWEGFDPNRASAEAFVNQVVNTRLISILRKRSAQKRSATVVSIEASDERIVDRSWSGEGWRRQIDIKNDLNAAMKKLTPRQREICDLLLREAVTPASRELGIPRSTLRDAVSKIREVFRDAGLEEYFR